VQREDDREETVRARLAVYATQTVPLLDYYRDRRLLSTVSGEGDVAAVGRAIRKPGGPSGVILLKSPRELALMRRPATSWPR